MLPRYGQSLACFVLTALLLCSTWTADAHNSNNTISNPTVEIFHKESSTDTQSAPAAPTKQDVETEAGLPRGQHAGGAVFDRQITSEPLQANGDAFLSDPSAAHVIHTDERAAAEEKNEDLLPSCADWFYRTTALPRDEVYAGFKSRKRVNSVLCVLPTTRAAVLGSDQWHVYARAKTRTALETGAALATVIAEEEEASGNGKANQQQQRTSTDFVAIWQVGPHSPATQSLLHDAFPYYFMNLSHQQPRHTAVRDGQFSNIEHDGQQGKDAGRAEAEGQGGSLQRLAERLHVYNARFGDGQRSASPPSRTPALKVRPDNARATGKAPQRNEVNSNNTRLWQRVMHALAQIKALLSPVLNAVASLLSRVGVLQVLTRGGEEAYANAREHAWTRWSTFQNIFYTRQLTLRLPLGEFTQFTEAQVADMQNNKKNLFSNRQRTAAGDNRFQNIDSLEDAEDNSLLSRREIVTKGALTTLRLISFPPIAQRLSASRAAASTAGESATHRESSTDTVRYACALPAVKSAVLVLQAAQQQQQQQQQQRVARERKSLTGASRRSALDSFQEDGAASSVSGSRAIIISYVLNAAVSLLRRLFFSQDESVFDNSAHASRANSYDYGAQVPLPFASSKNTPGGSSSVFAQTPTGLTNSAATVHAARAFLQRVREELGPHQSSAISTLPVILQQLLKSRVLSTKAELLVEVKGGNDETFIYDRDDQDGGRQPSSAAMYVLQWTASLPAGTPMCLALAALPDAHNAYFEGRENVLPLAIEETLLFDHLWLALLCASVLVWLLASCVEQSGIARHLVTGLLGTVLLSCMLLFYLLRELQRMSVGKLAVVAAVLLGGSTVALEGIFSVLWSYYNFDELWATLTLQSTDAATAAAAAASPTTSGYSEQLYLVLLLLAVVFFINDLFFHFLFSRAQLEMLTRWAVQAVRAILVVLCVRQNCEATAIFVVASGVLPLLLTLWSALTRRGNRPRQQQQQQQSLQSSSPRANTGFFRSGASKDSKSARWTFEDPTDDLPAEAAQAKTYVPPLAVRHAISQSGGDTASTTTHHYAAMASKEARLRQYEEDGAAATRRALEELAAHLRANPGKYATRLRDPNGVQRWAGGTAEGHDDDIDE